MQGLAGRAQTTATGCLSRGFATLQYAHISQQKFQSVALPLLIQHEIDMIVTSMSGMATHQR